MKNYEVVDIPLNDLKELEYNPNEMGSNDYIQLINSLKKFKVVEPAVVNMIEERKYVIVGGNHRVKAAREIGWDTFPCHPVYLTIDQERELALRLNKNRGEPTLEKLKAFEENELLNAGYTFNEVDEIFEETIEQEPEEKIEKMELEPYENYDYIVLMFRNTNDWLNALQELDIKKVEFGDVQGKKPKIGLGRVIDGTRILQRLQGSNNELGKG